MSSQFLARQQNMAGGISTGGADTGMDVQPQPSLFTKQILASDTSKEFVLPEGFQLLEVWVLPNPKAPPASGTVNLVDTTNSLVYANALDATVLSRNPLATPGVLPSSARFRVTHAGLSADSAVSVGFLAVAPVIRA